MTESTQTDSLNDLAATALIVAHPVHTVVAAGLIQQLRPSLLFLTYGDGAGGGAQLAATKEALEIFEQHEAPKILDIHEAEFYERILAGDVAFFLDMQRQIAEWLADRAIRNIITDGYEWYSSTHDVGSLLVQLTAQRMADRLQIHELAIAGRLFGPEPVDARVYTLTDEQLERKQTAIDQAFDKLPDLKDELLTIPEAALKYELICTLEKPRDFRFPPEVGHWTNYDDHGRRRVREGRYRSAVTFAEHVRPIALALAEK